MHPIQSPQNRFCVLTLDPETLPAVATILIDVLFYSHRWALRARDPPRVSSALCPCLIPSVTLCLRVPDTLLALHQRCRQNGFPASAPHPGRLPKQSPVWQLGLTPQGLSQ